MKLVPVCILLILFKLSLQIPLNITNVVCTPNPKYMTVPICKLEKTRRGINLINFQAAIHKRLEQVLLKFTVMRKSGANYKNFLIDTTEDMCKVFARTERSNIANRLMAGWEKYGNFPMSCPVQGAYSLQHFPFDLSFFPSIVPAGEYKVKCILTDPTQNEVVLRVDTLFRVKY